MHFIQIVENLNILFICKNYPSREQVVSEVPFSEVVPGILQKKLGPMKFCKEKDPGKQISLFVL